MGTKKRIERRPIYASTISVSKIPNSNPHCHLQPYNVSNPKLSPTATNAAQPTTTQHTISEESSSISSYLTSGDEVSSEGALEEWSDQEPDALAETMEVLEKSSGSKGEDEAPQEEDEEEEEEEEEDDDVAAKAVANAEPEEEEHGATNTNESDAEVVDVPVVQAHLPFLPPPPGFPTILLHGSQVAAKATVLAVVAMINKVQADQVLASLVDELKNGAHKNGGTTASGPAVGGVVADGAADGRAVDGGALASSGNEDKDAAPKEDDSEEEEEEEEDEEAALNDVEEEVHDADGGATVGGAAAGGSVGRNSCTEIAGVASKRN